MTDQEKREKVIKGLECCLDINGSKYKHCLSCDYRHDIDHCQWTCQTDGILEDALALLKVQEPRVMTLEEVIERRDSDAVWVEHMDGEMIVQPAVLLPSFLDIGKDCIHFASSWRTGGSYGRRSYGTKWRCWTSRPTDEQRKAVKWE